MKTRRSTSWNEDIEVEFGGPLGPRIFYPKDLEEGEIEDAIDELCPEWDGDWSLQVETDKGRYSSPLFWRGK